MTLLPIYPIPPLTPEPTLEGHSRATRTADLQDLDGCDRATAALCGVFIADRTPATRAERTVCHVGLVRGHTDPVIYEQSKESPAPQRVICGNQAAAPHRSRRLTAPCRPNQTGALKPRRGADRNSQGDGLRVVASSDAACYGRRAAN
jgi:hypothetical protein